MIAITPSNASTTNISNATQISPIGGSTARNCFSLSRIKRRRQDLNSTSSVQVVDIFTPCGHKISD